MDFESLYNTMLSSYRKTKAIIVAHSLSSHEVLTYGSRDLLKHHWKV